jgi:hypothetical protein
MLKHDIKKYQFKKVIKAKKIAIKIKNKHKKNEITKK